MFSKFSDAHFDVRLRVSGVIYFRYCLWKQYNLLIHYKLTKSKEFFEESLEEKFIDKVFYQP